MRHLALSIVVAIGMCGAHVARGDDVTLIAPGGVRAAIQKLVPEFERKTGHRVIATFGSGGGTRQRVVDGEPFDVPIVQPPFPAVLASGNVVPSSETPLATVAVAVAVRKGDLKPDISTPEAARALLNFLSSPDVAATCRAAGMQPGR